MIEIHIIYMSNWYNKRRGSFYHGRGKKTPHFQDNMFVTHDRNSHHFYEQCASFDPHTIKTMFVTYDRNSHPLIEEFVKQKAHVKDVNVFHG